MGVDHGAFVKDRLDNDFDHRIGLGKLYQPLRYPFPKNILQMYLK